MCLTFPTSCTFSWEVRCTLPRSASLGIEAAVHRATMAQCQRPHGTHGHGCSLGWGFGKFLARVLYRESGVCVAAKLERSDYGMMHEELDTHHK